MRRETRRMKGGQWWKPSYLKTPDQKVANAEAAYNKAARGFDQMKIGQAKNALAKAKGERDEAAVKAKAKAANPPGPSFTGSNPMRQSAAVVGPAAPVASRFSIPSLPASWTAARAPPVDPALKTSVGFLKTVVEGKNWARATVDPADGSKYLFTDEPEKGKNGNPSDDRFWTGKAGVSEKRVEMGLPGVYYNQDFEEYNTQSPIWTTFKEEKNEGVKWYEPKNLVKKISKGRFFGKTPPDIKNTMKAFKNSYLSKQKNDYTRRYDAAMAKAKGEWAKIAAAKKKELDQAHSQMTQEYKAYLAALQKDVEAAYTQSAKDLAMTKRVELDTAATEFAKAQGYNPGKMIMNGNVAKDVKLMNAMIAAAAAAKVAAPVAAAPVVAVSGSAGPLSGLLAQFKAPAVVAAVASRRASNASGAPSGAPPPESPLPPLSISSEPVLGGLELPTPKNQGSPSSPPPPPPAAGAPSSAAVPAANGAKPPAAPEGGEPRGGGRRKSRKNRSRR
jgi:hypothetical protein